ncbi:MAG: hypothetical protein FJX67_17425 [Alphaproteobacteria bacterium]|nr:hypothetical protein [Alphaproteobacteria bacterium]
MKISIDVDCSPEEARRFLGLPDVTAVNETLVAALKARMTESLAATGPEAVMKAWFPAGAPGMDQWRAFWSGLAAATQEKGERK